MLNENTVADKYPLPLISDQIARLRGAKYFSCIDMASGFYQIPVHEDSIERTAFVTREGQYEFGVKNAPSVFQRAKIKALGALAYTYAIVYIDDVLIIAESKEDALVTLQTVLETLSKAGFSFNVTKCSFLTIKIEYLGFELSNGEVMPNSRKNSSFKSITTTPKCLTAKTIHWFSHIFSAICVQFLPNT